MTQRHRVIDVLYEVNLTSRCIFMTQNHENYLAMTAYRYDLMQSLIRSAQNQF